MCNRRSLPSILPRLASWKSQCNIFYSAGQLAVGRTALPEAIAHLDRGLTLVRQLSPSPQRDRLELQIRNALGTAWWARKGWMADEMVE